MGGDVSKNYRIVEHVDLSELVSNPIKDRGFSWSLAKAVQETDELDSSTENEDEEFSVFDYGENQGQYWNAIKILKSIRHPNIMTILCDPCGRKPEGHKFATHLVEPLVRVLPSLDFQEVMGGIHDIIRALSFLHSSAGISHNAVCLHSIFVAKDGVWKLGCFESAQRALGEGINGDIKNLVSMLEVLLEKLEDLKDENLQSLVDLQKELELMVSSSSSPESSSSVTPSSSSSQFHLSTCLSSQVFQQCKFVRIRTFLTELLVESAEEKSRFFRSLISELTQLPEELVAKRLSVLLLQRFVLLDKTAREFFLPSFLTPKEGSAASLPGVTPVLGSSLFERDIHPILIKVFTVHDAIVRTALLENFSRYFRSFSRQQLQDVVLNELLLSARDQNDQLVELSLRALADLVSVLGADLVIRSQRVQHFYNGQMKEPKLSQTTMASGFDPVSLENGKHLVEKNRKTLVRLDGLLKVENKSDRARDGKKSKDWRKVLVNTVDLSDQKVKTGIRKATTDCKGLIKMDRTYPVDKEERGSQPTLLRRLEDWGADDSTLTDSAQLDNDDFVRSKSLENLYKNQASRPTRPVAVIEPKTTYQLANQFSSYPAEVKGFGKDSEKEVANNSQVQNEARPDDFGRQTKSETTQKSVRQAKNIPLNNNEGNAFLPVTLLDISQSSIKIQSKPLSLGIGQPSKDTKVTDDIGRPRTEEHQHEDVESSEWDDKWEDLEVPSIAEDHPKTLTTSSHFSSKKTRTDSTKSHLLQEKTEIKHVQLVPNSPHQVLERAKANLLPNCHPKLSEVPLGFGYDIKQIHVKVKPGTFDDEWKLFEDLMPSLESQRKSNNYKSQTLNSLDLKTQQGTESKISDLDASGWEAEELNLDLE